VRFLIALRAFLPAMNKKYRDEYRRQKRAESASQISSLDQEMLELMSRLRRYTYGGELGDNPRALAAKALMLAIDHMAGVITGDREYFYGKPHSLAQGHSTPPNRRD
jgi:hypothetical protein